MLVLSRPSTQLRVAANESDVTFPAEAVVNIKMSPDELFGLAPLTGKLCVTPVGLDCGFQRTNYRGPGRISASGSYPSMQFSSRFLGHEFSLVGNVATFKLEISTLSDLELFVAYVDSLFTALISGAFHAPVDIEEIDGTVQEFAFTVHSSLSVSNSVLITPQELPLKSYFDNVAPQAFVPSVPVVAALRYLQQADRLQAEGRHLTTFLAERLLNIAKALEALFPGEVDDMRRELATLNVASTYSDAFASARYLRNQVDVGHVSFTDLLPGQVQEVFEFADLATNCLRALINSLLRNREAQERLVHLRTSGAPKKVPNAVGYIRKYSGVKPPKNNDLTKVLKSA